MSEVHFAALGQAAREGIDRALDGNGLDYLIGRTWMELHDAAQIYFYLRAMGDRSDWFPSGKWATLQHLEALCDGAATHYLETQTA